MSCIIVLTGTSGSGRKTVARKTGERLGWVPVLSCTTRPPRHSDQPDRDYRYISREQFTEWEQAGDFVQTVEIGNHKYGILSRELEAAMTGNRFVYLILNREGAQALKDRFEEQVVRIFIYVDKQTLRERLESKGTSFEVIEQYLNHYTDEVMYRTTCEYVFENLEVNRTVELICEAMKIDEQKVLEQGN